MTSKSDAPKGDSTSERASGKHIPAPPAKQAASDEQGPAGGGEAGEPGSTLNPQDPAAPNYVFQGAGDVAGTDQTIDQGTGVQPVQPVFGSAAEVEDNDSMRWEDTLTSQGRVISLTMGEDGSGTSTRSEVLPHTASDQQVEQAKARLRQRAIAA